MDMQTIGEKVRQTRKTKGITQEQLANLAGLSTMSIRRYESGERIITDETLQRIADALGVQPWELDEKSVRVASLMASSVKLNVLVQDIINHDDISPELKKYITSNDPKDVAAYLRKFGRQLYKAEESTNTPLSSAATKLLELFNQLNISGQQKAVERVEELTEIPRYQAGSPAQAAGNAPPPSPEGKDTTPPPPPPESP